MLIKQLSYSELIMPRLPKTHSKLRRKK